MFKWPDPPEGRIIVKLPFTIYWTVSGSVTFLLLCVSAPFFFTFSEWKWGFPPVKVAQKTPGIEAEKEEKEAQIKAAQGIV